MTTAAATDARIGRDLFDPSIRLPAFVLRERALAHDIATLAAFCHGYGISFAPHGKTTMSPAIFRRQADAGAWAITVAQPWQAEVAVDAGIERILIANEVVDDAGLDWIGDVLDRDGPELLVLADSVAGVERMAARLAGRRRPLPVLVDIGMVGGRTGVRTTRRGGGRRERPSRPPDPLQLAGVSVYEGVVERRDAGRAAGRRARDDRVDPRDRRPPRAALRPLRGRRDRHHRRRQHVSRRRRRRARPTVVAPAAGPRRAAERCLHHARPRDLRARLAVRDARGAGRAAARARHRGLGAGPVRAGARAGHRRAPGGATCRSTRTCRSSSRSATRTGSSVPPGPGSPWRGSTTSTRSSSSRTGRRSRSATWSPSGSRTRARRSSCGARPSSWTTTTGSSRSTSSGSEPVRGELAAADRGAQHDRGRHQHDVLDDVLALERRARSGRSPTSPPGRGTAA